ncbi:MAG: hypothetical protein KKE72_11380 [Gammaproteobacteria bacterium]|nr:hypothetical protein [Gammaproteobacteria bacterium]MBU2205287.1 hypothetical protein [Gammaproteobacteria bacterium]
MSDIECVPEGKGFEIDYDKYGSRPTDYYKNSDEWWSAFAKLGEEEFANSNIKTQLLEELKHDKELAIVINHFFGQRAFEWLDKKGISKLGGLTPRQCLGLDYGLKRLRMLLLMMH